MVKERNIVLCIIFSIITCGIYGIYWVAALQNDSLKVAKEEGTSGAMVVVLTFITCGFYGFYWAYKLGERTDKINGKEGNGGILYIILMVLGVGFINNCITQATLNKHANA
jgi:hypothetical protein